MISTPAIALGAFPISNDEGNSQAKFTDKSAAQTFLNAFRQAGYTIVDTARVYGSGTSEELVGQTDVAEWAEIDTKVQSFAPGSHSADNIKESIDKSVAALKPAKINIMYLHAPDRETPFAETCKAMDAAHKAGHFKEFGLSNFAPNEVEEVVKICEENKYVKPTVYQGQYNAIARLSETELVPVLRKHGLKYYAYSPSASGIFTGKLSAESAKIKGGRFDEDSVVGKLYGGQYLKPEILNAAGKVHKEAEAQGVSGHEVALRWVLHHSVLDGGKGDVMILGASSMKQLEQNLKCCQGGPLPDDLVKLIDETWEEAKATAPHAHM